MNKKESSKNEWVELLNVLDENEHDVNDETAALTDAIRSLMQTVLEKSSEDAENNDNELINVLLDDDYLLEELVDRLALVSMSEQFMDGEITDEAREKVYLGFFDTFFELSKTINPLGGFDKGRLQAALSLLADFEKRFFPLTTRINAGNAEAFRELIPDEHYDDIIAGNKRAIGALRHIEEDTYAAGAIVYSVLTPEELDAPLIRIEWINVREEFRSRGTGNMLMARVAGLAFQNEGTVLSVCLPVYSADAEELEDQEVLKNFLESWKFEFEMSTGEFFTIRLADLKDNEYLGRKNRDAISLNDLGDKGPELLKRFFRERAHDADERVMKLPYGFFDPDVSSVIVSDGKIRSVFLVHRFENGNYRYELLRCSGGYDSTDLEKLLGHSYETAAGRGVDDFVITGSFESEEGYDAIAELIPDAHMAMTFYGILKEPAYEVSNEEWDELRHEAGLSDDKIPQDEDALDDETISRNEIKILKSFLGVD